MSKQKTPARMLALLDSKRDITQATLYAGRHFLSREKTKTAEESGGKVRCLAQSLPSSVSSDSFDQYDVVASALEPMLATLR